MPDKKSAGHYQIISVWIENDKGEVLLQQRSMQKRFGAGLWTCAVEGTVEEPDAFLATAKREIAEEIGVTDIELTPAKRMFFESEHGTRDNQGYKAISNLALSDFVIQVEEVEQLAWVDRSTVIREMEAGDPKYPPINSKIWLEMFDLRAD